MVCHDAVVSLMSGDEDPVELQIEGRVMIIPARNPTNVIAYSVYLTSNSHKTLLGRVAASGSKPVTFKLHAAYKAGQNLLVVSSYSDLDMDEGVVVPVEDYVEAYSDGYSWYDWGGYGGHAHSNHARPNGSRPAGQPQNGRNRRLREPWLEPKRSINDFQLLWTDEALGSQPVLTSGWVCWVIAKGFSFEEIQSIISIHF